MTDRERELAKEVEEAHLYLDEMKVPRARDDNGAINSVKTRIEILAVAQRLISKSFQLAAGLEDVSAKDLLGDKESSDPTDPL